MIPAIRTPVDGKGETYSKASRLDCSNLPDLARQEFREECDTNYILSRFGLQTPIQQNPQYGDTDWDIDLHTAHVSLDRAKTAFFHLPPDLRKKYGSPAVMLDAMNSGELDRDLRAAAEPAAPTPEPVPAPTPTPEAS